MRSGDKIKDALGLPGTASDEVTATALRDVLTGAGISTTAESTETPRIDDPQEDFEKLAELYAKHTTFP